MDKIVEHNGKKYRAIKNDSKESSDCSFCDIGDSGDKCGILLQCKAFHYYKEIKENSMNKSELSFKVAACSDDRRITIFRAFKDKNIDFVPHDKMFIYCTGTFASGGNDGEEYDKSILPEMTFIEAMNAIESVEPDAPEFDIKPFDRVLLRDLEGVWSADFFNRLLGDEIDFVSCQATECIKYKGNEKYHGTTDSPPGWWECENGKPVWRTK